LIQVIFYYFQKFVSTGSLHTLFLNSYNQVISFCDNSYGQLGTGDFTQRLYPY
jgi:hypothetical protein